jgi:hypothetical protein
LVIEQYTIATTPKYNFPQPNMDTILPQQFIELSLYSLKHSFQLNQHNIQQISNAEEYAHTLRLSPEPIPLKPLHKENIISAVDTSTIKIGDTDNGIVVAVRGANVWKQNGKYRYTRIGPFIFHITEENKSQVHNTLERAYFGTQNEPNHQNTPNLLQMPTRIATLLERWLQKMLSRTMSNGLILFDGSLTSGTPDTPTQRIREILTSARKRANIVLAFSKMTTLRVNGHLITDLLPRHQPPYLLEADGFRPKPPVVLLGNIYVARLSRENYAFRVDIDKEVPREPRIEAVEKLIGNDVFSQSYPETLRLAHILCTFTANEVLAMQHFVTRKFGVRIFNRPDMHRLLFGPYGKGEAYQ